jgi:hypothetical protein
MLTYAHICSLVMQQLKALVMQQLKALVMQQLKAHQDLRST